MNVAIVGTSISLSNKQKEMIKQTCRDIMDSHISNDLTIVSGGAEGVDKIVESTAREQGLDTKIYLPTQKNWESFKVRNLKIVDGCDILYCITIPTKKEKCYHHILPQDHEKTAGCWTMDKAKQAGKKCKLIIVGMVK